MTRELSDPCECCAEPAEPTDVGPKRLADDKVYCADCAYALHEEMVARLRAENERLRAEATIGPVSLEQHAHVIEALADANDGCDRLREALIGIKNRCDRIVAGEYGGLEAALEISNEARRALRAAVASDEQPAPEDSIAAEQDRENDEWAERVRSDEEDGR
jgi:hypothetical protein